MATVILHGKRAAGRVALVDDADFELVSAFRWNVWERERPGRRAWGPYAVTSLRRGGVAGMHTLITGWPMTDHKNHDGLDNRRANLRPATHAQNAANQRPRVHSSRFKGVTWHKGCDKWQAAIRRQYLGVFDSEENAALAYDAAAASLYGEYAYLNLAGAA